MIFRETNGNCVKGELAFGLEGIDDDVGRRRVETPSCWCCWLALFFENSGQSLSLLSIVDFLMGLMSDSLIIRREAEESLLNNLPNLDVVDSSQLKHYFIQGVILADVETIEVACRRQLNVAHLQSTLWPRERCPNFWKRHHGIRC